MWLQRQEIPISHYVTPTIPLIQRKGWDRVGRKMQMHIRDESDMEIEGMLTDFKV